MKVVLNDYKAYYVSKIEHDSENEVTLRYSDWDTRVSVDDITKIDPYSKSDLESDRQNLKCLCGDSAEYMCECGCPCCGEDPCGFCNGRVSLLEECESNLIPRTSSTF